jgi:hypothetical protein
VYYIHHATELADYADELWNERNLNKNAGRSNREESQVNAEEAKKVKTRARHNYNKKRHIASDCRYKKTVYEVNEETKTDKELFAFCVVYNSEDRDEDSCQEVEELTANCIE